MIQTAILLSDPDISAIDDSTESIGSVYQSARAGGFGDCAVFDFSFPGPLTGDAIKVAVETRQPEQT